MGSDKDAIITIGEVPSSTASVVGLPLQTSTRPSSLHDFVMRISGWIQEWTPFMLICSYFVFSVCLYIVCSELFLEIFWLVYMITNFYIAGSTVMEAVMSMGPSRDARKAVSKVEQKNWVFPTPDADLKTLDLIMVAYLPNEQDIIMDRIHYLLDKIIYPADKLRINILYNTPRNIEPLETEMWELQAKHPQLCVTKVPNSTSKADNLNYFLSLDTDADIIAIYDCDHYPHPYGPRWAMENFMQDEKLDIVQGRCVVFNAATNWLTSMVAVEFDKIYAVSHPGRAAMWGFGIFCGSNGFWRASLLKDLKMDGDMLTEDIDSALRALSAGAKVIHDLNVISYELAPVTFQAFWKQRLRWAQGWVQASFKHAKISFTKPEEGNRDFKVRFGLWSLLLVREFSYYLVTQYTCLVISILIVDFPTTWSQFGRLIFYRFPLSEWFFFIRYGLPTELPS
jgi:cellulose synthase/poly-beta-1,6-N-acetylglucosamine synthase-like glycosyltransferase